MYGDKTPIYVCTIIWIQFRIPLEEAGQTSSLSASLIDLLSLISCCDRFMTPMMPSFTGITRPHKMSIASVPNKEIQLPSSFKRITQSTKWKYPSSHLTIENPETRFEGTYNIQSHIILYPNYDSYFSMTVLSFTREGIFERDTKITSTCVCRAIDEFSNILFCSPASMRSSFVTTANVLLPSGSTSRATLIDSDVAISAFAAETA